MFRRTLLGLLFTAVCFPLVHHEARPAEKADLPKVVLLGDSIRLGYAPLVMKKLQGKAVFVSTKENGADSSNILRHLDEWIIKEKPALVYLNCGLHDLKKDKKTGKYQVGLDQYEENLKQIVARLRKETSATLVFVLTTPILDDRHAKRGATFDRFEADVKRYNQTAAKVMKDANVVILDLHEVVEKGGADKLLGSDGTHYTKDGYEKLADTVAESIVRELAAKKGK